MWVLVSLGGLILSSFSPECGFIPPMPLFSSKPTQDSRPGARRRNWCGLVVLWDKRLLSRPSGTFLLTSNSHFTGQRCSLLAAASVPASVLQLCSYFPQNASWFFANGVFRKVWKWRGAEDESTVLAAGRGSRQCHGEECEGPILPSPPFSRLFAPWLQELFTLHNSKRTKTGFLMQMTKNQPFRSFNTNRLRRRPGEFSHFCFCSFPFYFIFYWLL